MPESGLTSGSRAGRLSFQYIVRRIPNTDFPSARVRALLGPWYRKERRALPWRATRDPYRIWISEIMLQQTRVAAVMPYYERFLNRFPDCAALARASEEEVLRYWSGLGYYSRARNLHKAARTIAERGSFPDDYESIRALAGVGDYTAAAVASIAFELPYAVLDGNVARVLARLLGERGEIASAPVRKRLRDAASKLLDPKRPGAFNQAMMELGATVCLPRQPECARCPIARHCIARQMGIERELPVKRSPAPPIQKELTLLLARDRGRILLWQRKPDSRRLAGFWELPEREQLPDARLLGAIGGFNHSITNHRYAVSVIAARVNGTPAGFRWISRPGLARIPLSTTTRKALALL